MSFHGGRGGRGGGGFRGGGRGRGGGGRGRGFGGGGGYDQGPPDMVIPIGYYSYPCQGDLICKVEMEDVPFFNAPIYLENKECVGKIDEIFGNLRDYFVSIRLSENMKADSFKKNTKLYINPEKIMPLKRFLPQPPGSAPRRGGGRGRGGRGGGDGRGGGGFRGRGGGGGGRGRGRGFGRGNFGGGGGFRGNRDSGGFRKSFGGGFKR